MRIHKKHGVLLAGINGLKIYSKDNVYRIVGRGIARDIRESDEKIVEDFVNIKYMPLNQRDIIISNFLDFIKGLL